MTTIFGHTKNWTLATMETRWEGRKGEKVFVYFSPPQIVDVNLTSEGKVKLEAGMELPFSYQVNQSLPCINYDIMTSREYR